MSYITIIPNIETFAGVSVDFFYRKHPTNPSCTTLFHPPPLLQKQITPEQISNVEKKWRTRQEKEELIALWKQSDKNRKLFCIDQGLSYNSFVSWHKQHKAKAKTEAGLS